MNKKKLGRLGEVFAKHYLILQGYQVIYMNYLVNRYGEIDIIAIKNDKVEFVEVKTRSVSFGDKVYGTSKDAVDSRKLKRLSKAITYFLAHDGRNYRYYTKKLSVVTVDVGYVEVEDI